MLINLSNHPYRLWKSSQKSSALKKYNSLIDVKFPHIPPKASRNYVLNLARIYSLKCQKIISESKEDVNAIHIMGEHTFIFALVSGLKKKKITCLASTTKRITNEMNNKKEMVFNFERFREY